MSQDSISHGRTKKTAVFVRVYKTLFEHYAVVYKNEKVPSTATYICLKNCQVFQGEGDDIKVVPDNLEGIKVTFEIPDSEEIRNWLNALTPTCTAIHDSGIQSFTPPSSPIIPKSPTMPPVLEDEEI